jgi:CubicO group peptidase (beta-lactamase class C family)
VVAVVHAGLHHRVARVHEPQRLGMRQLMGPGLSWGMCVGLDLERVQPWMTPGRFWWNGGSGTTACVNPANDLTAVLLTQRMMTAATGDFDDFWRAVYQSLVR